MYVILRVRDVTSGSKSEIKSGQGWHARPTLRVSRSNFSTPRMERETSLRGSLCKKYSLSLSRNNSRIPRGHRLRVLRSSGLVRERGERYVVQISYRRSGVSRPRFWGFWVAEFLENWSRRLNRLSFASFYRHRRAIVRVDFVSLYGWNFLAPIYAGINICPRNLYATFPCILRYPLRVRKSCILLIAKKKKHFFSIFSKI